MLNCCICWFLYFHFHFLFLFLLLNFTDRNEKWSQTSLEMEPIEMPKTTETEGFDSECFGFFLTVWTFVRLSRINTPPHYTRSRARILRRTREHRKQRTKINPKPQKQINTMCKNCHNRCRCRRSRGLPMMMTTTTKRNSQRSTITGNMKRRTYIQHTNYNSSDACNRGR